jgi:hypothetical protein
MPRDSLSRMIERADREKALRSRLEPERLILPPRPDTQTKRICVKCRKGIAVAGDVARRPKSMICPDQDCKGDLVEVVS